MAENLKQKPADENPIGKPQEKPGLKMPVENASKNPGSIAGLSFESRRPHGVVDAN